MNNAGVVNDSYAVGSVKSRRQRRQSYLMKRQRRRNRPTVIHHTSMVSTPVTVDLCSVPSQDLPSCIDLTNDTDESEIVDLTSPNDSVVCLDVPPVGLPLLETRTDLSQRNYPIGEPPGQPINLDTLEDEECLPVFDCGKKGSSRQKAEEPPKKRITCSVCYDDIEIIEKSGRQMMSTVCGHLFCESCIRDCVRVQRSCPNCRKKLTAKQIHPIFI